MKVSMVLTSRDDLVDTGSVSQVFLVAANDEAPGASG